MRQLPDKTQPWRPHNRFEMIEQGKNFFPAMLEAIAGARVAVALEIYWMETGRLTERFIQAFTAAAGRGVQVYLLIDDFGSADLDPIDRRRLATAGVVLARYNPLGVRRGRANLMRDHRKLLLIDGTTAFVGGTGLSDVFDGDAGWRETMLRIEGECVGDWWNLFADTFNRWSVAPCQPPVVSPVGATPGQMLPGRHKRRRPLMAQTLAAIARARERVWLVTPYFLPPARLRRALARARRREVDVRVLVPAPRMCDLPAVHAAGRRYYDPLLRRRLRLYEFQPRVLHQKVLLADDRVLVGSSNFDRWGLRWHLEADQAVSSASLAEAIASMLERDFRASRELTLADWRQRSWPARWREWFWGWVERQACEVAFRRRVARTARRQRRGGRT